MQKVIINEVNHIGISEIPFDSGVTQCLGASKKTDSSKEIYLCEKAKNIVTVISYHWCLVDNILNNKSLFYSLSFDDWLSGILRNREDIELVYFPEHICEALQWIIKEN